jgi:DNA-binding NtrC family response regulator
VVLTGEAEHWLPALEVFIGPKLLAPYRVDTDRELIKVVEAGVVDAAILDEETPRKIPVLQVLRMIRSVNTQIPVVLVTQSHGRRMLEDALRLAAFSVVGKPLQLEQLMRLLQRIMIRVERRPDAPFGPAQNPQRDQADSHAGPTRPRRVRRPRWRPSPGRDAGGPA